MKQFDIHRCLINVLNCNVQHSKHLTLKSALISNQLNRQCLKGIINFILYSILSISIEGSYFETSYTDLHD